MTTEKISPREQRRRVMGKAELMLTQHPHGEFTAIIRELLLELALLDGVHALLFNDCTHANDRLHRALDVIAEDLPHAYLTHRLYALMMEAGTLEVVFNDLQHVPEPA